MNLLNPQSVTMSHHRRRLELAVLIGSFGLLFVVCLQLPYASDWENFFRPAGQALWQGRNPYSIPGFFNPPWLLLLLGPLALLPAKIGQALLSALNLSSVAFVAYRLRASPAATCILLLAPGTLYSLIYGNVDWIPLLGLLTGPTLGLFLVLVKPQMGLGVALYFLLEAWDQGGINRVIQVFAPVTLVSVACLLFHWYPGLLREAVASPINFSLFPWFIPVGLGLVILGRRKANRVLAMPAGLCLSPYFSILSVNAIAVALLSSKRLLIPFVVVTWISRLGW